jgi:hypothetical protein
MNGGRLCAVYTRKSSEEGLEQSFNSLHAQREACEAFVKSQAHEGWKMVPEAYDDGGFSGGSLQRPALQRLLEDLKRGHVHTIVVYKVDRLTRSLADFAKIVDVLARMHAARSTAMKTKSKSKTPRSVKMRETKLQQLEAILRQLSGASVTELAALLSGSRTASWAPCQT